MSVLLNDFATEHAVEQLLDTVATSSKAIFWDAAADPTILGEEIIKKLGYFLLSSDANISLTIMQKVCSLSIWDHYFNCTM